MSDHILSQINAAGQFENIKPKLAVSEMTVDYKYVIQGMEIVHTKYGPRILLQTGQGHIWPPKRMCSHMTDEWVGMYKTNTLAIISKGVGKLDGNNTTTSKLVIIPTEK